MSERPEPPWDRDAERAVIGAAIRAPALHQHLATLVTVNDFWLPIHQRIWTAIGELDDIGPFIVDPTIDVYATLAPLEFPSSHHVRAAAVAVLADLNFALAAHLSNFDDGRAGRAATRVARLANRRTAIAAAETHLAELREEVTL